MADGTDAVGRRVVALDDWIAEGERRFGDRGRNWKFKCVMCGHVQTGQDFLDTGMSAEDVRRYVGFSCIGRFVEGVGCNWTLGGLFQLHTLEVVTPDGVRVPTFEFAHTPIEDGWDG